MFTYNIANTYFFSILKRYRDLCVLLSFPTRRSSDLVDAHRERVDEHSDHRFRRLEFRRTAEDRPAIDDVLLSRHAGDRKSTRLNSSHVSISYAVFCLKKKKTS